MNRTKALTLAIATLGTCATAAGAVSGMLEPKWALLVAAMGSGAYALTRTLQKVLAGSTWKSLLTCTESWGVGLVLVAGVVSAAAGVVPVGWAAGFAASAGVLLKVARVVQALKLDVPTDVQGAQPKLAIVPPSEDITKPEPRS